MRLLTALCLTAFSISAPAQLSGQQPPLPTNEAPATELPAASPPPSAPPPPLIPDEILPPATPPPAAPDLQQLDETFKQKPLTPGAVEYRLRVEWRKLRSAVSGDPSVKAALATANTAKTDLEKRKLLGAYYELLYGKMLARASTPELKGYLNVRKADQLRLLPQPNVRPTPTASATPKRVISRPPVPQATAAPTPLPTPDVLPREARNLPAGSCAPDLPSVATAGKVSLIEGAFV